MAIDLQVGHLVPVGIEEVIAASSEETGAGENRSVRRVRAVALTNYLQVASSVGLDGARLLQQAGISPEALSNPENRLPAGAVFDLLDRSAKLSGCDSFGLLMVEGRSFASLGPLSLLLEHLPNAREVVRASIEFQQHIDDVVSISLEDVGDTCLIRLDLAPGFWSVQAFDHIVAMGYRVLTGASGGRWKPDCVHLVRKAPDDPAPWRRMFAAPIQFEATFNGMSTSAEALLVPNPHADDVMARHARQLLQLVHIESPTDTTSDRVRRAITLMLPSGRATIDHVASQLGMSVRSLQRRLGEEGRQFGDLLKEVRRELATAYLANSTQPVTTVAGLLGYASPSSFTRWFAGTFGTSPQAWRADIAERDGSGPSPTWRREGTSPAR